MIKFALVCHDAHEFESWFPDGAAYETQVKRGQVVCPVCSSSKVGKAIMAPALIARRKAPPQQAQQPAETEAEPASGGNETGAEEASPVVLLDERQVALRAMMQHVHAKIMENTDDVGKRFSVEARRMHDGEIPNRSIRGEASLEDARELLEDGIQILPVPMLPEEWN